MGRILDLISLRSALYNTRRVETDEANVRKLINLSSKGNVITEEDLDFIKSIDSNTFAKAYRELHKPIEELEMVKDLVLTEYARDNLNNSDYYIGEDEDIY